jgi:two-component system, cell cycle sensor histidine kinase and response regulator CckA
MTNSRTYLLSAVVALSASGIFLLDAFVVPLGVAIWLPYIAVILLSLWMPHPRAAYCTAALCSVLTIAGLLLSPAGTESWLAKVNRPLAILAFWIAAAIGLKARRTQELEASNKALHQEIQRREQLETQMLRTQRLESIGVLTGGIAHDFNNLLTPILMATKLLKEERPDEERRHLLETLQASAERAAELVRKLLAFAGGGSGERTMVNIERVVNEIKEIVEHSFPKGIAVRSDIAAELPPVLGDPTQLSQVLMNFCVNARDAMPSGGTLSISADKAILDELYVRTHPDARVGTFVRLAVEDTGCGMSPEIVDRAFDPFFTTKSQGKGTGLGLSTALGIVRSHRGFLDVQSSPGRGSRFAIYLPAQPVETSKSEVSEKVALRRGNGELVLVVDDEDATLQTVKAVLECRGYRVLLAHGGIEAFGLYDQHRAEVGGVLLDLMMPDMDGLSVMAKLREKDPNLRITVSSGLHPADRTAETLSATGVAFLSKPYSDEQLLAALARMFQVRSGAFPKI